MSAGGGVAGGRRKIRVAVVGTGEFGRNHVRVYRELENVELAGVFDTEMGRAKEIAKEFHTQTFQSIEELRGEVHAASVAVPTEAHRKVGCGLLEMGIDALVEKPMARTVEEADELIAAARRNARILQVGHVERFNPAVLAVEPVVNRPLFFEVHRLAVTLATAPPSNSSRACAISTLSVSTGIPTAFTSVTRSFTSASRISRS